MLFHTMSEDRLELARRHVIEGRRVIAAQQELIERLRAAGKDTTIDERLLRRFEQNQVVFEKDLEELEARYQK
jgi:hypothetical protein